MDNAKGWFPSVGGARPVENPRMGFLWLLAGLVAVAAVLTLLLS